MEHPEADSDPLEGSGGAPAPRRWRWTFTLAVVGLAGLLVGYALGASTHSSRTAQGHRAAAPTSGLAFALTGETCSEQRGDRLQLGIQIQNQSTSSVHITGVESQLPIAGALRALGAQVGVCGQIGGLPVSPDPAVIRQGMTTWLTASFHVLVRCPAPFPVRMVVHYMQDAQSRTERLPGFNDLGHVPYTGCGARRR